MWAITSRIGHTQQLMLRWLKIIGFCTWHPKNLWLSENNDGISTINYKFNPFNNWKLLGRPFFSHKISVATEKTRRSAPLRWKLPTRHSFCWKSWTTRVPELQTICQKSCSQPILSISCWVFHICLFKKCHPFLVDMCFFVFFPHPDLKKTLASATFRSDDCCRGALFATSGCRNEILTENWRKSTALANQRIDIKLVHWNFDIKIDTSTAMVLNGLFSLFRSNSGSNLPVDLGDQVCHPKSSLAEAVRSPKNPLFGMQLDLCHCRVARNDEAIQAAAKAVGMPDQPRWT